MIVSAHLVCQTRLCRAEGCDRDAENYSRLCYRCQRLDNVKLHQTPPPGEPTLWCSTCRTDKPDREFGIRPASQAGRPTNRRGRFWCCLDCERDRKRTRRANLTPEDREEMRARDRARKRPT